MSSATVLLSGGLDSSVLLHYVAKKLGHAPIYALSFNYGQRHNRELRMARWQAHQLDEVVEHHVSDMTLLGAIVEKSTALVAGGMQVPDLEKLTAEERVQPSTYVPNRNMILLSLAAAFAESRACRTIYFGAQAHDEYGYWDCTQEFVDRLNAVLRLNRGTPVQVLAPFVNCSKADGVRLGAELGVDFSHTWSCYRGGEEPCGTCPTCVERSAAFEHAGIVDPATARE